MSVICADVMDLPVSPLQLYHRSSSIPEDIYRVNKLQLVRRSRYPAAIDQGDGAGSHISVEMRRKVAPTFKCIVPRIYCFPLHGLIGSCPSFETRISNASTCACSLTIPSRRLQSNASPAYSRATRRLPRCSSSNANRVSRVVIVPLPPSSLKKTRHFRYVCAAASRLPI